MNTSAQHISVSERKALAAKGAKAAGWSRADLLWEELMEKANIARAEGQARHAARYARRADLIARLFFPRGDLRRATGQINLAILDRQAGRAARADTRLDRAARLWDAEAAGAIAAMQIAPRSRSSLFHLRMEARHRDTFHGNMRHRFTLIAGETFETVRALRGGGAPAHRHFGRWKGERPVVFDDTRKVLSACLLIFDG